MQIRSSGEHGIASIYSFRVGVNVKTSRPGEPSRVWVDGAEIGYVQNGYAYPEEVTILIVHPTGSGECIRLASDAIPFCHPRPGVTYNTRARSFVRSSGMTQTPMTPIAEETALETREHYRTHDRLEFRRENHITDSIYTRFVDSRIGHVEVNFAFAAGLSAPVVLFQEIEYTFHRTHDGGMTDLRFVFPSLRPFGNEWAAHGSIRFAQDIRQENWPLLLRAIEGAFFTEINTAERLRQRIHSYIEGGASPTRPGQCIDATLFEELGVEVSIGDRLVCWGRIGGRTLYLVDGPNYGVGLYVFRDSQPARDWANGRIPFEEARRLGRFIPHADGWQDRLRMTIGELTAP